MNEKDRKELLEQVVMPFIDEIFQLDENNPNRDGYSNVANAVLDSIEQSDSFEVIRKL